MIKKIFLIIGVVVLAAGLAIDAGAADKLKVGLVFDIGGRGDQSFNDSAYRGLEWASKLGIKHTEIEPGADADRETGLRMIAGKGFDLIFGVGFLFTDAIKAVAAEFPDTKFAIIDGFIPDIPNVSSLLFREHEGSFLVGMIAALRTKTDGKDTVGFVGGMDIPLIHKFEAGYKAGVAYVDKDLKVLSDYAGTAPRPLPTRSRARSWPWPRSTRGPMSSTTPPGSPGPGSTRPARSAPPISSGWTPTRTTWAMWRPARRTSA